MVGTSISFPRDKVVGAVSESKPWAQGQHDFLAFTGLFGAAVVQNLEIQWLLHYLLDENVWCCVLSYERFL
jgi:hypothetical protein